MNISGRKFQFWKYSVSHGMALIRSPKDDFNSMNIDIYCGDVQYLEIPRHIGEIIIDSPTEHEMLRLSSIVNKKLLNENILILNSSMNRFAIVMSRYNIKESDVDIFDCDF